MGQWRVRGGNAYGESSPPSGTFVQVGAGAAHSCGLRTNGELACWGDNSHGQSAPPGGSFFQVSAGGAHSCGLTTSGDLTCWGDNSKGQSYRLVVSSPK